MKKKASGFSVVLVSPKRGSIKRGVSVRYRGVSVGSVSGVELADSADHVKIHINIDHRYSTLVRQNTQFWNASGLDVNFKLFRGATLKTDSLESILEGGIGFATADNDAMGDVAKNDQQFKLHDQVDQSWLQWSPTITLTK